MPIYITEARRTDLKVRLLRERSSKRTTSKLQKRLKLPRCALGTKSVDEAKK